MYEVIQVDEGCWRIEDGGVRCFLVVGTEQAVLVDTGFGTGDLPAAVAGVTQLPVMLVNTHADGDHIGGNGQFAACHMHPAEFDRYATKKGAGVDAPRPLWEGDVIALGGRQLEVVLIPGHTPGSIALLDREHRVLISGDSVQDSSIYMFGPGRNLPGYIASLERLAGMAGLFDRVYPSHGSSVLAGEVLLPLLEGAKKVLRGEIAGKPREVNGMQVMEIDVGVAKFLYA